MKNKFVYSSLFLLAMCTVLTSCKGKDDKTAKEDPNASLYFGYSTENLRGDWDYNNVSNDYYREENKGISGRDSTLRYHLTQGEKEGLQLIFRANRYINNFDFKLPTLTGPNGAKIGSENFSVSAAWYQYVSGSLERHEKVGLYPDALIPLENYKWRRMDHVDKDKNQSLYIDIKSTEDMVPGKYTGSGELILDDQKYTVPFEVTIYDFKMPEEAHWVNSFLVWYEEIVNGERENANNELYLTYYNYLVDHRMSPDGLPDYLEANPTTFANAYTEIVAKNPRITSYRMPTTPNNFSKEKARGYLQALITKNIELRQAGENIDLFKKLYFYVNDEPTATDYDKCRANDKAIFELKKEMSSQLNDYPDLKESFTHIENLVTINYSDELRATNERGGVQCWCPQYQWFQSEEARQEYKDRQNSTDREFGENVWWYGCMDPASPYPSFHLDAKLILGRCISYMQYNYGIEGNIYWNVCYYSKQTNTLKSSRDIWYDPMTWINCAGDGALLYPGIDYGMKEPIPTLRLQSIQAGSEDYELLYFIDQKVNEYNELNQTSLDARALLQKHLSKLFVDVTPYTDSNVFNDVRVKLLKTCEKLNKNLNEGIEFLQRGE